MRLLCEYDDGTVVGLPTAIQRDPCRVRGLVSEAFFQCLSTLPDTDAFVRAEHSFRDALVSFEGSQDRYVKAYVVSRGLDARTKTTPRASIIQSSFIIGGPLALIATFYATFNVSRNPRSRETLDYLLQSSTGTRDELFERARTFPCHPSTSPWFQHIIDKLEPDVQSLAYLLVSFGSHPHGVPAALFKRFRRPSCTWDRDGQIVTYDVEVAPFLRNEAWFSSALQTLQSIGLLKSTVGIYVDQQLVSLLDPQKLASWRGKAARVVCHAFPKHSSIEPDSYKQECELLLPVLQHVLSDPFEGIDRLQISFLSQAIEACLSSLDFGELSWKLKAIVYTEHLLSLFAGREPKELEILRARVAVNKLRVRQVYEWGAVTEQELQITFPRDNHRSSAFSAELTLLKAQVQIDVNNLDRALQEISSFDVTFDGLTSPLGTIMKDRVTLVRGSIFRFGGHFSDAAALLGGLSPTEDGIVHLSAILCEQGEHDRAIKWLDGKLQLAADPKPDTLRLAWAHAHLSRCLQAVKGGRKDELSVKIATETYLCLSTRKVHSKFDTFSILVGQAVLLHIEEKIQLARNAWFDALGALQSQGLPPGFFDALLLFSLSDLALREHGSENSRLYKKEAGIMLTKYSSNYRFLGLGSLWPNILYGKRDNMGDGT
ncbi:hypothetical protein F4679DRAFT_544212 [Xylaria curta]|nr:hypothetical protein F4679DRAFT_544212 [Xylaria curta]